MDCHSPGIIGLRSVRVYSTVRVVTQHISAAYTSAVAVSNDEETVVRVASEHLPWSAIFIAATAIHLSS